MLTLTNDAINHILNTMNIQEITLEITEKGCAEYTYSLSQNKKDCCIIINGITVYYDLKYFNIVEDTIIDYIQVGLNKFFKISNVNATNTCGCGISFSLEKS